MSSPQQVEFRNTTAALIAFASDPAGSVRELKFDDADLSVPPIGHNSELALWWNQERSGLNLRQRHMAGASLRRADLSRADLAGTDLTGVRAAGIKLQSACLEGTLLIRADLIGAALTSVSGGEANFSGALLEDADVRDAHLRFTDFRGATLDGANFDNADLWGSSFENASAERASFEKGRLDEAVLDKAEFPSANFNSASLRKAKLRQTDLRGATFRDCVLDGTDFAGANLTGAVLPNVSLTTCNLTHTRFAGAWLERTRMQVHQLGGQVGEEAAGDLEAALDSYIVLERNFLSLGSSEDVSWAYRRRRRVGRKLHLKQTVAAWKHKEYRRAAVTSLLWLGDVSAEWLCDYGESVTRVVRAFLVIVVFFAVVYWLTGSLRVREGAASTHAFLAINYVLFSINSMTTVGTSEVALRPAGELGMLLSSLQTIMGTILLGLFGFVLGARIRN